MRGVERFRGSVRQSETWWINGRFWHRAEVDESVVVFRTLLGCETRFDRAAVGRVEFERRRLFPFRWETNVRVHHPTGQRWLARFVPMRPRRLRSTLERFGWPVVDVETVGYRAAVRRAIGASESASD